MIHSLYKHWKLLSLSGVVALSLLVGGYLYFYGVIGQSGNSLILRFGNSASAAGVADSTADGTSDDVNALALLNLLPTTGGRISVLTGTYAWTAGANVTRAIPNVHLDGTGYGTYVDSDGATAPFAAGGNNWVISNMRFDAPGPDMGATTGWLWENVWVGATHYAMSIEGASVLVSGGALGTPSSGTGTNLTGIPAAAILAGSFGAGNFVVSASLQAATIELGHATDTTLSRTGVGTIAVEGTAVSLDGHAHTTTTISGLDVSDDINLTAGRSLTLTADDVLADAELYTDTKCLWFVSPTAIDDFKSIWFSKLAVTLTSIWAESDQTVTFMLQVDDGSPADVDSVDLAPAAGTAEDTALDGDTTMAAGDRLDLDLVSVAGTPTWVSICWTLIRDD